MISKLALASALAFAPTALLAQAAPAEAPPAAQPEQDTETTADKTAQDIVVTGRFVDTGAKSAMKQDIRVLDTPFSVASYSSAFVKSLETTNVADLYNYMNGVKKSGNTGYDITLRGFKGSGDDRNTIMVDGLPGLTGRYGSPPTIGIDHIELVKGPMSVLYGQIQPGGFVNLITKKPLDHFEGSASLRFNTFAAPVRGAFDHNGVTGDMDITGPVDKDGKLRVRFVAQIGDNDGYRDYAGQKQQFISPSFSLAIGSHTTLIGQLEYRNVKEHFDTGIAAPANGNIYDINLVAPITTVYQQPSDFRSETGFSQSVFLTHSFGGSWKFSGSFRHVGYTSDQNDTSPTGFITVQGVQRIQRRVRSLQTSRDYAYGDANISGRAHFVFDHQLLLGFNIGADQVQENRSKFFNSSVRNATTGLCPVGGVCLDIPLYNPSAVYGAYPTVDALPALNPQLTGQASLLTNKITKQHSYGIYFSDLVTLLPWLKVDIGLRNFSETADVSPDIRNQPGVTLKRTDKRTVLPSAGILIEPTHHLTFYGSYAESYVPADPSALDGNGNPGTLHPITAKQYEIGVKTENLLDGKLSMTAAVYQIDQDGQITQNPCTFGTCSFQTGKGRSRGFEFEGNATPLKRWQVVFGYSHIDAKILTSDKLPFQIGQKLPNVAPNAANLWTRYDLPNGLGIGAGVVYTGDRAGLLPTAATDVKLLDLPAYVVVDTGLYYTRGGYSLNLKVGNILNKKYYESAGATGRIQISPGQPRYLTLTGRVKF
jgi:iron complex outermembrane receptor protein